MSFISWTTITIQQPTKFFQILVKDLIYELNQIITFMKKAWLLLNQERRSGTTNIWQRPTFWITSMIISSNKTIKQLKSKILIAIFSLILKYQKEPSVLKCWMQLMVDMLQKLKNYCNKMELPTVATFLSILGPLPNNKNYHQ